MERAREYGVCQMKEQRERDKGGEECDRHSAGDVAWLGVPPGRK